MQETSATMQGVLDRHETATAGGASFDLLELVEIYAADYVPGSGGFDPADAEERFCGVEGFTFLGLAYDREYVERDDVKRFVGSKENQCGATFSNVSRALATYIQQNDVEGKWMVFRVVSPFSSTLLADAPAIFYGRLERPGDVGDDTGSLLATQRFGRINLSFPRRTFGPNDPKGRAVNDPDFEGFRFTATQATVLWTTRERRQGWGSLLGLTKKVKHSFQASSHTNATAEIVVPDSFGRVQLYGTDLATIDIGGAINFSVAVSEGAIAEFLKVTQTNPKFSQINGLRLRYGYRANEGPSGREQVPVKQTNPTDNIPGDGYYSRTAWLHGFVTGSTPDVDEAEAPDFMILILAKIVLLPDGSGDFTVEDWTDNPAYIARHLFTSEDYFNEGADSVEDAICIETADECDEYVVDRSQGERLFVGQTDAGLMGTEVARVRSTGLVDPRTIRIGELNEIIPGLPELPPELPPDVEPFDPINPPTTFTPKTYLRRRHTCNLTLTEKRTAVDFLYGPMAETGRLYFVRNGKGRIEIRREKPVDNTRIRGAVAAGDTTIKVLDVEPWKTGSLLLKQKLLVGAHQLTSEGRRVTAAAYTSDGNAVTITKSTSGGVTATLSGATFSGGSSSAPAAATITIGGSPAAGNTVTVAIAGISVTYALDSYDTTATAAAMLARLIHATPALRQFVKASWAAGTSVVSLSIRFGVLTLDSALANPHTATLATPTATLVLTATSGGSLPAGTIYLAYAYTNAVGETGLSPVMSVVVTANQRISVPLVSLPAGATGINWYVGKYASDSELVFHSANSGAAFFISTLPDSSNALPEESNTTGEELMRVAAFYACNDQDGSRATGEWIPYPLWQASKAVALNDVYLPTTPNGRKYSVTTAGTTGTSEPSWTLTPGGTVGSGTAVFTEYGPTVLGQAGLIRGNIHANQLKWPLGGQQSNVNQLKGTFYDAKDDFAATPLEVNDFDHQARTRKVNSQDVDLSGFDNYWAAAAQLQFRLSKLRDGDKLLGWSTGPAAILHEEGDVVCVSGDNGGFVNVPVRLEQISIGKAPTYTTKLTGRLYSTLMFSDRVRRHSITLPTTLRHVTPLNTEIQILDIPFWRERDAAAGPGVLITVRRATGTGSWKGTHIWLDTGDGARDALTLDVEAVTGEALTVLADHAPGTDTTSTVRVRLDNPSDAIATVTDDELRAGANLFRLAGEIFQAKTVTPVGGTDDEYDLTNLVRGLYGTENETAGHVIGDEFTVLDGKVFHLPIDAKHAGSELSVWAVTVNQDFADATEHTFTWEGNSLKPLAPARVELEDGTALAPRDQAGNVLISPWPRSNIQRIGEEYRVDYLNDDGTEIDDAFEIFREGTPQAAMLISDSSTSKFTGVIASAQGNTFSVSSANTTARARALQKIRQDGNFAEANLRAPSSDADVYFGLLASGRDWRALNIPSSFDYCFVLSSGGGGDLLEIYQGATLLYTEDASSYVTAGKRFRFRLLGNKVQFFKDYLDESTPPLAESVLTPNYPLLVVAEIGTGATGAGHVEHVTMTTNPLPATVLTAAQQTAWYGGLKTTGVRVRIRQHSGIREVGYGLPWEGVI